MTESGAEKKEYGNSPGITGEAAEKLRHIGGADPVCGPG